MNDTTVNIYDNQAYLISIIDLLNKTISQFGLGLIMFMGNIGSVLTCIVFYQPTFHKNPCAMYFLASSFSQFFTFNFSLLTRMIHYGYNIQTLNTSLWYCKTRSYLFYLFIAIPRYNIIFASIDRYFASSRDALRRQWSSSKIAFRLIIGNIFFWCILYIQVIIFYDITTGTCYYQSGAYGMFFSIYISIDSGILPTCLMLVFGLLTLNNVHQTRKRINPGLQPDRTRSIRFGKMSKKDVQFHRMLANQICLFVILNLPNPCYLIYRSSTLYAVKSPLRRTVESFVGNMTYVPIYLGFSLTFANFAISSQIFRQEFIQFIQTKILRRTVASVTRDRIIAVRALRSKDENE
ncbi:unnamed protein product [Adineta steineri]|uniref:G-protein coupled receptors family 1 profile domain-containing protein n=1 Tax=Adineta steineri TaxID=433720 RepID=A0A819B9D8_9BILA|nr:unnamed protein product [Adineta steineri]CAF0748227.1 unnamed protein product [Adineta steineri]CAF3784008.1 unnamed protein product [Adineta steineri]CAF3788750.1 unnamed protein product [Adineta steineri]